MINRLITLIVGVVMLLSSAAVTCAQISSLEGTVKGRDGAPLSGAIIRIDRTDFRGRYQTKTAKNGRFFYAGLPLGTYNVTCNVDGNDVDSVTGIRTQLGDPIPVNFDLRAIAKKNDQPSQPSSGLGSTYVNSQNSADRLQLKADRSFALQEGGQSFSGTYSVTGSTLKLHIVQLDKDVEISVQGNRLIVNGDEVWIQANQ